MPDFSKCKGKNCPKNYECKRYVALASYMQSYSNFDEIRKGECDFFYPLND